MAKRKQGGLEQIAGMPWPVGVVLGIIAFVVVRHGIGWFLTSSSNPILHAMGKPISAGAWAPIAWMTPRRPPEKVCSALFSNDENAS
jgi:restriction system protein